MKENHSDFILFKTEDEKISVDVRFEDETVWLTQEQMALLFGKAKSTINEHIQNVFNEGELDEALCTQKFGISEFQQKAPNYYNLDVIISVGYRVKSLRGTQFRQWATHRLNEYIRKGFTMDDERLKNLGGGGYWKELLQRIRDIRASEKVFYRQVLDIYSTSIDYNPKADVSIAFFKKVQNIGVYCFFRIFINACCHDDIGHFGCKLPDFFYQVKTVFVSQFNIKKYNMRFCR